MLKATTSSSSTTELGMSEPNRATRLQRRLSAYRKMSELQVGQERRSESGSKPVMGLKSWDREYSQQAAESETLRQNEDGSIKEPSTTTMTPFRPSVTP